MQPPILEALRLPDTDTAKFSLQDEEVDCILCDQKFTIGYLPTFSYKTNSNSEDNSNCENSTTTVENSAASSRDGGLLRHLLLEHNFVIGDVHLVANLPQYVKYWKNKFKSRPLAEYCVAVKASVTDKNRQDDNCVTNMKLSNATSNFDSKGKTDDVREFWMLSHFISEDKDLRQKLHTERLESVIRIHEAENCRSDFHRSCLFCRQEFTEHPSLFDHMAFDHNFNVGQPANLVFVDKFLDVLLNKLESLVCLFCEKVFKSREVLKEHMRKKGHKKLNPQNKEYDAFYLVNYLEFGRTWEDISKDPGEEEVISGFDVEKDDNYEWGDWRDSLGKMTCLFCAASYTHNSQLFNHMLQIHGFDFELLKKNMGLSFYQQVKMINFIRRCVYLNTCLGCSEILENRERLLEHLSWSNHFTPNKDDWNQPQFLFPTYENDNLLHCLEEDDGDDINTEAVIVPEPVDPSVHNSILQDENVRKSLMKRNC